MTAVAQANQSVGTLLRQWRERRRMSQLDLAIQAEVSARHLSFVETGRSKPSSDMILRLTDHLDVPLRERNRLLLAGGYAPVYSERPLDSPQMAAVRTATRQVLTGHDPYPAVLVDRHWNLLDANASIGLLTEGVSADLLAAPNALRMSLHPDGTAPRIVNLGEWRAHLLHRLRRQAAVTADPVLRELYQELRSYPCDQPEPEIELPAAGNVAVPLQIRVGERVLSFISITAVFGTPLDVTLSEMAIESFYPANDETSQFLRHR
jgi:transcriptional regulator with XRE-family HTH domain